MRVLAKGKKKTQTLSFDVLVAVGVFVAAVVVILYLISQPSSTRKTLEELTKEGETISSQLISTGAEPSSEMAIVVKNRLQKDALAQLAADAALPGGYERLKSELGVIGDFCIHFEDEDGNLVDIEDNSTHIQYSVGSPDLNFTVVEGNDTHKNECSITCGTSVEGCPCPPCS